MSQSGVFMIKKKPIRFRFLALIAVLFVTAILAVSQYFIHFSFARSVSSSFERETMALIENNMPYMLTFPVATKDKHALKRIVDNLIDLDFVYSVEIRDADGNVLAYEIDTTVPTEEGVKIVYRTIEITDDRSVMLDDLSTESARPNIIGRARIALTPYKLQQQNNSELTKHLWVLIAVLLLILIVIVAFAYLYHFSTRRMIEGLKMISERKYRKDVQNHLIAEMNDVFNGMNSLSENLTKTMSALEKSDKLKKRIINRLSIDLGTPVSTVANLVDMMSEQITIVENGGQLAPTMEFIRTNITKLTKIIEQLGEFNSITSGRTDVDISLFNAEALFDEHFREFSGRQKNSVSFEVCCDELISDELISALVVTDYSKVKRIIQCLTDNSFKYTDSGAVRVEWSVEEVGDRASLSFIVQDSGRGIRDENIGRVFDEAFVEEEAQVGWGLGLTLVKAYLDLLGGTISISSKLMHGTRVYVRIPVTLSKIANNEVIAPATLSNLAAIVLDDNVAYARHLSKLLASYGIESRIYSDAGAALDELTAGGADIVFVDYDLHSMFAAEFTSLARSVKHDLIVVSLSPKADVKVVESFHRSDSIDFSIRKPVRLVDLDKIFAQLHLSKTVVEDAKKIYSLDWRP